MKDLSFLPSATQIQAVAPTFSAVSCLLPEPQMSAGERMVRGGQVFAAAPAFVVAVSRALAMGCFPDIPVCKDALLHRQAQATAYRMLHEQLKAHADAAWEAYLLCQSDAIDQAMGVVRQVRADAERPFPGRDQLLRQVALREAEEVLAQRAKPRKRKATPVPSSPRSPQKKAREAFVSEKTRDLTWVSLTGAKAPRRTRPERGGKDRR
jgi:hypothetical protein